MERIPGSGVHGHDTPHAHAPGAAHRTWNSIALLLAAMFLLAAIIYGVFGAFGGEG